MLQRIVNHWGWYLALGIVLVIGGSLALVYSLLTTLFFVEYLGILLLFAAVLEIVQAFRMKESSNTFLHIVGSIFYAVLGALLIADPIRSAVSLTFIFAIYFIVVGLFKLFFALIHPRLSHIGWIALNGALNLLLGILIFKQWPDSGLWVIGMFIAIDMIFTGWAWIMIALKARTFAHAR